MKFNTFDLKTDTKIDYINGACENVYFGYFY